MLVRRSDSLLTAQKGQRPSVIFQIPRRVCRPGSPFQPGLTAWWPLQSGDMTPTRMEVGSLRKEPEDDPRQRISALTTISALPALQVPSNGASRKPSLFLNDLLVASGTAHAAAISSSPVPSPSLPQACPPPPDPVVAFPVFRHPGRALAPLCSCKADPRLRATTPQVTSCPRKGKGGRRVVMDPGVEA